MTELRRGVQNEMTNGHKIENRFQNEMMNDHKIENWVQNELTDSIEYVGQAVSVRSDTRHRQITFGIDTAACRTVVPARHPATRHRCHWDTEAGVQCSTAGKSVMWDEGRRLLVSKETAGKVTTI